MTTQRSKAERTVDTLRVLSTGLLPEDLDHTMEQDVDGMRERYSELKGRMSFSAADSQSRLEFVERVLAQ
ncbi:hypothetical protein [Eleftheria terrae]|uniref:hypothetical protein n=1 Tax=Eleftheria terrae TaxID=1597781 RepID=UPI00263B6DC0|nr:hypothetical protein [Eleftheria terrae]WKB56021.1 hypothetical protein N7L95_28550 [Eleftheria terrae]